MSISSIAVTRALACFAGVLVVSCGGGGYGGDGGGNNPPATLSISVSPTTITLGESATLSWSSNAGMCTASGDWSGSKPGDGSETVTPATTGSFTYSMRCSGGGYRESQEGSATLTVNPAGVAATWIGEACCIDSRSFGVTGMTDESGGHRLLLADRHVIAEAGAEPIAYATCSTCLAGARVSGAPKLARLVVTPARAFGGARIEGSFTTHVGTGYTLTLTIDSAGQIVGSDTNGCQLDGRISTRRSTVSARDIALDVSRCGARDGRYVGRAGLLADSSGEPAELLLSASNADAAIGWRLGR